MNSFIFVDWDTLSLNINNVPFNVDSTHPNWDAIVQAVKASNFEAIPELINVSKQIETFTACSNIQVNAEYGTITYHGEPIHNTIVEHIFRMKDEGFDITPMVRFLDNLMSNPSKRAVDELYGFMQAGKLPVTDDGCFIAYKRVRDDYKSVHDGKTDNSIGVTVAMPRNMVNENSQETCSTGLHFCSQAYLNHFSGDRIVILKVNPRDVVSIPADYNDTKGRACQYDVIGELTPEQKETALQRNIFVEAVHNAVKTKPSKAAACGPKLSSGKFAQGYASGYSDHEAGCEYDDECNFDTWTQEEVYTDGYSQGWADSCNGAAPRYAYMSEDDQIARAPISDTPAEYRQGYRDGRNGVWTKGPTSASYQEGFRDGKGHKAKQH